MNTKDNNGGNNSQEVMQSGAEQIESIVDLLKKNGFFDSVKPDNQG